ncbi:MAG: hypothetical protein LBE79_08430 [Tannerella sp.]|jgi:hypothetical protein|nr:hypothetical protein [Tannerella sp.]
MKRLIYLLMVLTAILTTSCAVLTKSQVEMVNKLTVASDTVSITPKVIFDELAIVRLERGLYYAASLTTASAREKEINALAAASIADQQLVNRSDVYVNVLNSYLRALRSISNATRWTQYGTEWRGLGRNIDSLIIRLNQTDLLDTDLTVGWAKLSGQYMGYLSEKYSGARQAKAVKSFVTEGDTLVAACVDGLVGLLQKGELIELIDNETRGLKNNYNAYLQRLEMSGSMPDMEYDRMYIDLFKRAEKAKNIRTRCITALQSLKRAHKKLVSELGRRKNIDYLIEELLELNTLALYLQSQMD